MVQLLSYLFLLSNSNSFANKFDIFVFCQNFQNLLSNSLAIGVRPKFKDKFECNKLLYEPQE